jgi:hypothetical protein
MEPDFQHTWIARTTFDRCMDDIAAAQSTREIDYLRREVRRQFASHARVGELERILDMKQRLLADPDANCERREPR